MLSARLYLKCLFIALLSIVLIGCGSNSVKKAKEFMNAGMYPQAMELLSKKIGEEPSDAEAHFLMGICKIYTNDLGQANERFLSAVKLKSDYGFQIGSEYKKAGNEALSKDVSSALNFYREAIKYQPALKDEISTELMTEGKNLFEKGQHPSAGERFMVAHTIKPELGSSIAEYYFQAGQKSDISPDLKTLCLDSAIRYDRKPEYLKKAGNEALSKNISRALNFYREAINLQPALKDEISTELMTEGKTLFGKGEHQSAGERFMTAIAIKPELGSSIAEYYFQAGQKPDVSAELKILCLDSAIRYDRKPEYLQAIAKHHYELSKISKTTEEAIRELQIANNLDGKYGAELKAKQGELEQEKFLDLVKKYESKWGQSKKVKLTEEGKWIQVCSIKDMQHIYYLSLHEFSVRDNANGERNWKAAPTEDQGYRISGSPNLHFEFKLLKKPTDIYYWIFDKEPK